MTEEQLRRAVVEPARQVGAAVEDGLVEPLLADLAPRRASGFANEAGALPLLSYALLTAWERAPSGELTIASYREAGGLRGAISQRAENLYASLPDAGQALARRLFLRLVQVAAGTPAAGRRASWDELAELGGEATGRSLEEVLRSFVAARRRPPSGRPRPTTTST